MFTTKAYEVDYCRLHMPLSLVELHDKNKQLSGVPLARRGAVAKAFYAAVFIENGGDLDTVVRRGRVPAAVVSVWVAVYREHGVEGLLQLSEGNLDIQQYRY